MTVIERVNERINELKAEQLGFSEEEKEKYAGQFGLRSTQVMALAEIVEELLLRVEELEGRVGGMDSRLRNVLSRY